MREDTRVAADRRESRRTWLVVAALAAIFLFALFVRSYWNIDEAHNNGNFVLSGGSDPYYHKHAVDYILGLDQSSDGPARWQQLLFDPLLNYPYGMVNPNPPLYQWSIAVTAAVLDPVIPGDLSVSAWWITQWSSVILGSLTVFPIYFLGREIFDRKTGIIAAFLWAVSTSAINNSSIGFADHDAMALFFILLGFLFYVKAINALRGERVWVADWRNFESIKAGKTALFRERSHAFANATLAGVSLGAVALVWKGFPYALGIIFAFALLSFLVDHWKNRDSTGLFMATTIAFVVALALAAPYYYHPAVGVASFFSPTLYILLALVVAGLVMVPTRDLPTILVIPAFIVAVTLLAVVAFFVAGGTIARTLLDRLVYFQGTTLYQTIAEAHPADFNTVAFAAGPVVFLLSIVAIGVLLWRSRKELRRDRVFTLVWAFVAIYMTFSAVRFLFNAVPVFVLLGGWLVARFIDWLDFGTVGKTLAGGRGNFWGTLRRSVGFTHVIGVLLIAFLLVVPSVWLAVDAGMPRDVEREYGGDNFQPGGFFYDRFGAYGQDYIGSQWTNGFAYLDGLNDYPAGQEGNAAARPAFLSWWDYGHWAIAISNHPAVADNFQNGYRVAGNWLLAQNETGALQVLAGQYVTLYESGSKSRMTGEDLTKAKYLGFLKTAANMTDAEAEKAFDTLRTARAEVEGGFKFVPGITKTEAVRLLGLLEEDSGYRIRYFAADGRMMPYDIPYDSGGAGFIPAYRFPEDGGNILNAPIVLTRQNATQFIDYTYHIQQPADVNPFGLCGREELSAAELARCQNDKTFRGQVDGYKYTFYPGFFNSMYYRSFVGTPPTSPQGTDGNDVLDAMNFAEKARALAAQGGFGFIGPAAGLEHFRLVWAQGTGFLYTRGNELHGDVGSALRFTEFYTGALVQGTVQNEDGTVISGATVVAYDDAGKILHDVMPADIRGNLRPEDLNVAHASVQADSQGRYSIRVPFNLSTSEGGLGKVTLVAFRNVNNQMVRVAETPLVVSRADANPADLNQVFRTNVSLVVKPSTVTGRVFYDANGDGQYNATDSAERILGNTSFVIQSTPAVNGAANATGHFNVTVKPGAYNVTLTIPSGSLTGLRGQNSSDYEARLNVGVGTVSRDLAVTLKRVTFNSTATYGNSSTNQTAVPVGTTLTFTPDSTAQNNTARSTSFRVVTVGNYTVNLAPGVYNVTAIVNGTAFQMGGLTVPTASETLTAAQQRIALVQRS